MSNPRKAPQLKIISGTTRKDRDQGNDTSCPTLASVPDPPAWLSVEAAGEFKRLASSLFSNGLLIEGSVSPLAHLAALHAEIVKHWKAGSCPSGHLVAQFRGLASDFGLTPVSRSRLAGAPQQTKINKFSNNGKRAQK